MSLTGAMNPQRLLSIYLGSKCLQFGNLFFFQHKIDKMACLAIARHDSNHQN